jgi:hypothetical protein
MLADLDHPSDYSERPVRGYQLKVGSEREPYWLVPEGDTYTVVDRRPVEPPFECDADARRAQAWFAVTYPAFASVLETGYRSVFAPVAVPA